MTEILQLLDDVGEFLDLGPEDCTEALAVRREFFLCHLPVDCHIRENLVRPVVLNGPRSFSFARMYRLEDVTRGTVFVDFTECRVRV